MKIVIATGLILVIAACTQTATEQGHGNLNGGSENARVSTVPTASHAHSNRNVVTRSEMAKASVGPTAVQVYANPREWTGSYVRLTCEIIKVSRGPAIAFSTADARCGRGVVASLANDPSKAATKEYNRELGDQALLVLVGDKVSNLGAGQNARIIGRITGSSPRKNGAGATIDVVTVRVDYLE